MNQILTIPKSKSVLFFKVELAISVLLLICSTLYMFISLYFGQDRDNISMQILDNYQLMKLYSSTNVELSDSSFPFILGTISIDSLGINYPIISECSDELLALSICRFYGPYTNTAGNLCLAGHNYNDNTFFSLLPKLKIGDTISISFSDETNCTYSLYKKYETNLTDTNCTLQNTNGKKEITLVTCNNITGNRMIFKANEI